jgi:hypothetical protein
MSIVPVQVSSPGVEHQTRENNKVRTPAPELSAGSGSGPKAEIHKTQISAIPPLIPEHEVKVQWDSPADHTMVYRILDKQSGALVLQVPSAEVLSGMHQTQELLERIASRGKTSTGTAPASATVKEKAQEKDHGNKL